MKKICFFSSDSRPLYKKNIYSVLSLPKGYIIHFRYQEKYVDFPKQSIQDLSGKSCSIFFTTGNDITIKQEERVVSNISIRNATIKEINITEDTGLIHFYLELDDYVDLTINENQRQIMPPNKFVSELELTCGNKNDWHERVKAIENNFPVQLFYKLNIFNKDENQIIPPKYDSREKQSYISLEDEEKYYLNIAFYHTGDGSKMQSLEVAFDNKAINLNVPSPISIGGLRDNRSYSLYTQALNSKSSNCYIQFNTYTSTTNNDKAFSEYDTTLLLEIEKNIKRSTQFGFYTLLTALSVAYGKVVADNYSLYGKFDLVLGLHTISVLGLGFFSAFKLYQHFNKK